MFWLKYVSNLSFTFFYFDAAKTKKFNSTSAS